MRHARPTLFRTGTICLAALCLGAAPAGAAAGPHSGESQPAPAANEPAGVESTATAATLDEILRILDVDALAVDMFMKIEGIKGESTAGRGHQDWIVIDSFGWGATRSPEGTGQSRRRSSTTFRDLTVAKKVDEASPDLYLACSSGKHIPVVELIVRKAGSPETYFRIVLENALITSVGVSHSAGDSTPTENVSLNYGKIHWEYSPQGDTGPGGKVETGWDLMANKKV
jgi:type VI secretion system secreted protein Hcp